jgi:hypothetical protein
MEPIFKVGDKVIVLDRIYKEIDYKFNFTDDMLSLKGIIFTIETVFENFDRTECFVKDDCALYKLKEDSQSFSWSSGMLMKAESSSNKTFKIKEKIRNAMYSSLKKQGIKI